VTRRKNKHLTRRAHFDRKDRVDQLLVHGWIKSESEIPADAIPADPRRVNLGGSWDHPKYYRDLDFTCRDCGLPQTWKAADQLWYYETIRAPFYCTAVRCRACRKIEQQRQVDARSHSSKP
jgi:hypothetical protein